jgi:hypothetical protein
MPKATLKKVGQKAMKDEDFFRELIKKPEATLRKAKMQLSPQDLQDLKAMIRNRRVQVEFDPVEMLRVFHSKVAPVGKLIAGWGGGWPIEHWIPVLPAQMKPKPVAKKRIKK